MHFSTVEFFSGALQESYALNPLALISPHSFLFEVKVAAFQMFSVNVLRKSTHENLTLVSSSSNMPPAMHKHRKSIKTSEKEIRSNSSLDAFFLM
jgi:hypothetical protein